MPRKHKTQSSFVVALLILVVGLPTMVGCGDTEETLTPVACRAQSYRYSEYTGANYDCHCHEEEISANEAPGQACNALYDSLFNSTYSAGGSHDREFSFVTAAPGYTCAQIQVDPCDNTDVVVTNPGESSEAESD